MTQPDSDNTRPINSTNANQAGGEFARDEIVGGRYKVLSLLGKGGMGLVYRVEQIFLGKELALKTIHKSFLSEITVKRFEHEARAAFAVNHPNIIAVTAYGLLDNQTPFLAMEIVEGETLAELLQDSGPLPMATAIPIIIQACFGLAHAHDCGVVHRDIKPSNIMILKDLELGTEGSVKILDFGIAKFSHRDGGEIQALTKTGEIFGSPLYMSPEQCMGSQVDYRSDIYSLGCVIFETLTGKPPFTGNNALATLMMHQSEPTPTLAEGAGGKQFPEELESIVKRMLAKQPADRYQSLGIAAHDLASIVNHSNSSKMSRPFSLSTEERATKHENTPQNKLTIFIMLAVASSLIVFGICLVSSNDQRAATAEKKLELASNQTKDNPTIASPAEKKVISTHTEQASIVPAKLKADLEASSTKFRLNSTKVTGEALGIIATAKQVHNIDFLASNVSNENLDKLAMLDLTNLTLTNTNFNDIGAQKLAQVQSLQVIKANSTPISNQGLASLKRLHKLRVLKIESTNVDIDGVRNICQSKSLKEISLANCPNIKKRQQELLPHEFPSIKFEFQGDYDDDVVVL